jgi:hypothetical protein
MSQLKPDQFGCVREQARTFSFFGEEKKAHKNNTKICAKELHVLSHTRIHASYIGNEIYRCSLDSCWLLSTEQQRNPSDR